MRYRGYEPQVNVILDLARAARRVEDTFGEPAANFVQHLSGPAGDWAWSLIDIILDHEERQAKFRARWKRWRRARPRQ